MKKPLLLLLLLFCVWAPLSGQNINNGVGVITAGYRYYPYANLSSVHLSYGIRYNPYKRIRDERGRLINVNKNGSRVLIRYSFEVHLVELHYLFSNAPVKPMGSFGLTLASVHLRLPIGRSRLKLCIGGEFLGISTINEALGERIDIPIVPNQNAGPKNLANKFRLTNSVMAGLDFYITNRLSLNLRAGVLMRTFHFYQYPFGSASLSYDILDGGTVRVHRSRR